MKLHTSSRYDLYQGRSLGLEGLVAHEDAEGDWNGLHNPALLWSGHKRGRCWTTFWKYSRLVHNGTTRQLVPVRNSKIEIDLAKIMATARLLYSMVPAIQHNIGSISLDLLSWY